jgi:hypothetical protein
MELPLKVQKVIAYSSIAKNTICEIFSREIELKSKI